MSNTITVRRANVLLDVPSEQKEEYLSKGFDVIDKKGNVIAEAIQTNDVNVLQKKLAEAQTKIKALEAEIVRLNEELDEIADDEAGEQKGLVDPEEVPAKKSSKKKS